MSFQHFRLGDVSLHQSLQHSIHPVVHHHHQASQQPQQSPSHQQHIQPQQVSGQSQFPVQIDSPISTFSVSLKNQTQQLPQQQQEAPSQPQPHTKQPYGSGDADDGYTLVFTNLQEFNDWRQGEEERTMCEFVKGDTHGSKAVPPRFKDHTKLVCARHSRSGRKKYVKKHPERVRKVPSRKLEVGCPASISYKTYFDSEQVRACYVSQHSHEIGLANLPFTRRGRREAAAATKTEKDKTKPTSGQTSDNAAVLSTTSVPTVSVTNNATGEQSAAPSANVSPQPAASVPPTASTSFSTAVSMLAPIPPQSTYPVSPPQTYTFASPVPPVPPVPPPPPAQPQQVTYPPPSAPPPPAPAPSAPLSQALQSTPATTNLANDRWDNMATLFQAIREHARNFEYPSPSVAALETILIRLYLESPVGIGVQSAGMPSMMPTIMAHARNVANVPGSAQAGSSTNLTGGSTATDDHT